jgi:hypothetical protein
VQIFVVFTALAAFAAAEARLELRDKTSEPPEATEAATLRAGLERVYRMDYAGAEKILDAESGEPSAALL